MGAKAGFEFKAGNQGVGYYKSDPPTPTFVGRVVISRVTWVVEGGFLRVE